MAGSTQVLSAYAPIAVYLGQGGERWRGTVGRNTAQRRSEYKTLDRDPPRTLSLTRQSIFICMDAGFHSKTIAATLARYADTHRQQEANLAFLIEWKRRGHDLDRLIAASLED
ncbi:hypothetical protein [Acidithiobacillus caldus]|nr:hypothetical protein [Acidithiobacillus caldus]MBU2729339.1 hypothetical protein [Acidithiobacillus caldus]MBU2735627.1 hypothetical protein [Acidithiobacillus caldus ATCC 51756]MBU2744542.1 hypothetical protein [Acidithiobacillus caldus]MBU2781111.1 hypothetical protein [Acidithiobacillus caldus]MBU2789527.1 hypothetical protein [Acidithiobacillus caldus]